MLKNKTPANRLIIGDVGSGKTLVALMSLLSYLESFYVLSQKEKINYHIDVAFMAPTEVLANQHYQKLQELILLLKLDWLESFLVTNKVRMQNQTTITKLKLEKYFDKKLDFRYFASKDSINKYKKFTTEPRLTLWVGTQALLFLPLLSPALVFTDEQHRFGVRQRQSLVNSSVEELNQDLLVFTAHYVSMTATPIPRTLALTVYGDLKASYIKKINTRQPIITMIVEMKEFETKVLQILKEKINLGQKIYIVCPSIEAKEDQNEEQQSLWTVTETVKWLAKYFNPEIILSLHGKLNNKHDILSDFKNNKNYQILVSTTVIEVGVDVGTATAMMILNPERFGLSQLHQIRGRIGRNDLGDNICFLIADQPEILYIKRLRFLCTSLDGFEIAQEDLRLRGEGDLFGTTQSGVQDDLLGLESKQYVKIRQLVDSIDYEKIEKNYPRLHKYLGDGIKEVWGE